MPLFPNHETPPTKKIIIYTLAIIAILLIFGYFFPGGSPFQQ